MFPHATASIFLHVPKSGGSTIIEAQRQSRRFVFLVPPAELDEWEPNRLAYYGRAVSLLRKNNRTIALIGHPSTRKLLSLGVRRPDDDVFVVLRDPVATVISFINYIITCVTEHRPGKTVESWANVVGVSDWGPGGTVPSQVLFDIIEKIIPNNLICATLGMSPSFRSAVESIGIFGIDILFFDDIDSVFDQKNLVRVPAENASTKYVTQSGISDEVRQAILSIVDEDLKLYAWAKRRKETGSEDLPQDEQVPRQASAGTLAASSAAVYTSAKRVFQSSDLDAFVAETDRRGHVGSPDVIAFWDQCEFTHTTKLDQDLDPFGAAYVGQQLDLYRELSGRDLDQSVNELAAFDLAAHVSAVNPYAHLPAHDVAKHVARLSCGLMQSDLPAGSNLLDIGCGWGLSSEIFAYTGLRVTAVDINPAFVELVNVRARQRNLPIEAVQGTFEALPQGRFDAAAYYECLHHAVRPWEALEAVARVLRPGGKLLILGEPINNYWKNWGLRQDPLSIYCIRKFGWFESGWSLHFLRNCIERSGFRLSFCHEAGEKIGWVIVAERL
jgi:SAM-dependent methyltransferase